MPEGPFWMGRYGFVINGIAVITIIFFNIIFCFPYSLPVAVATMNYNAVVLVGVAFLTTVWWFVHAARNYEGPKLGGVIEDAPGRRRLSEK